jgi:hypothetical protein
MYWQYLDAALLRDRLWESLFYLHSQPPLFNLFLACVRAVAPGHTTVAFALLYAAMGLGMAVSLYALMVRLRVEPWLAALVTVLFSVSPPAVYFENYIFYEHPTAALLSVAALWLHRFLDGGRTRDGVIAFGLMAAVIFTRSLFQIVWLALAVAAIAALSSAATRRRIGVAAAVPVALTVALGVKNLALFGTFTTSSWFGMNLISELTFAMPDDTRAALIERRVASPFFAIETFSPVATYRPLLPELAPTGIAALDDEYTSGGTTNYNHLAYVAVSRRYAADALRIVRVEPWLYARGIATAASLFFRPASDFEYFRALRKHARGWQWLYHTLLYGQLSAPPVEQKETRAEAHDPRVLVRRIGWFILFGMPLLVLHGVSRLRAAHRLGDDSGAATLAFLLLTIAYLAAVALGLNVGENQRYRFLLEPFLYILLALWLQARFVIPAKAGIQASSRHP